MKRIVTLVLAITVFLGQAPAWALVCAHRCMPQVNLACVRICAKSASLLTQGGKLAGIGQACTRVETRFAEPSLAAVTVPALSVPALAYAVPLASSAALHVPIAIVQRAHAPPSALPAQAFLSVPVAQGPPALV